MTRGFYRLSYELFCYFMIYVFPFAFFFFLTLTVALRDRDTKLQIREIGRNLFKKFF